MVVVSVDAFEGGAGNVQTDKEGVQEEVRVRLEEGGVGLECALQVVHHLQHHGIHLFRSHYTHTNTHTRARTHIDKNTTEIPTENNFSF